MKCKYFLYLILAVTLIQCDDADKYYDRPEWLEKPIYEVLEQEGRFSMYLQCVDKTEYKQVLKGAGLYTIFAPNNEAFTAFLAEKSYASIEAIPEEELNDLVAYSIVSSKWTSEHLADYLQERVYQTGAFKRKTSSYALPYRDTEFNNNWVFNQTQTNGISYYISNYEYRLAQNNYKFLPIFTAAYFNSFPTPLGASDYNMFFPNSVYNGKNVQAGTILKEDIIAENGIIYEVSTVSQPMKNMDEILRGSTSYAGFKDLLDHKDNTGAFVFKRYTEASQEALEMFRKLRPGEDIDNIYIKLYTSLAFSPLLENVYSESTNAYEPEKTGNTLFIPKNEALKNYIDNRLLKYYGTLDKLPIEAVQILVNTHMTEGLVWPSLYKGYMASTGEYVNGRGSAGKGFEEGGIIDKKMASNGFVYMTDEVIKSRYFETVYSEIFLNPAHEWLDQAYVNFYLNGLREDLMKSVLSGWISERFTMLNFSDDLLRQDGYGLNSTVSPPAFTNTEMPSGIDDRLKRLMRMHIFPGLKNSEVDSEVKSFATAPNMLYGGWGFLVNAYGDLVRYKNNKLQAAGNIEDGTYVTVTPVDETFNNGLVFNVDKMLQYSPRESHTGEERWNELTLWKYLERAKIQNPGVSTFVNYVEACLKNPSTDELDGIKTENFYTILMVNNTAMNQAVTRGHLPSLATIQAGDLAARAKATQFLNAHILSGAVLPDDGLPYIYPVNAMSPNLILMPTLNKITDEALGLTNATTRIEITKSPTGLMNFMPQNVTLGTKILVSASFGLSAPTFFRVQRGPVTGSSIPDNYKSNRIACKAVLHEVNNYFVFTLNH